MRLFVALDIDDNIRAHIAHFLDGVREFAKDARWVRPESLHVTLKFIGERSDEEVVTIKEALAAISAESFQIHFRGYGFFPGGRAPRVFWIGSQGGMKLSSLAARAEEVLTPLGIPKEEHAFNPHLTLARGGRVSGSPQRQKSDRANLSFQHLQEKLAALPAPEFGTMTAREFFLYQSRTSPGGSKYTKLAQFALR
jgi:2'-5' RNA ligase